jgi:hypothetical protein
MAERPEQRLILGRFLSRESPKCPGCRQTIDRAPAGECPQCGEVLALEVRSLRPTIWTQRRAILEVLAIAVTASTALWSALMALLWLWLTFRLGTGTANAEARLRGAILMGVPLVMGAAAAAVWMGRSRLLRARLWVRLATLAVVLAAAITALQIVAIRLRP